MNEKELLCGALDNTSIKQGEENIENSNPTYGIPEQFCEMYSVENVDERTHLKPTEKGEPINSEKEGQGLNTQSNVAVSSGSSLCKNDLPSSKGDEFRPKDEGADKNSLTIEDSSNRTSETGDIKPQKVVVDGSHEDSEQEDCDEDVMTGSYGEISLDRELLNCDKNSDSLSSREDERCFYDESKDPASDDGRERRRPDSLVLAQNATSGVDDFLPTNQEMTSIRQVHRSQQTSDGRTTSAEASPSLSSEEYAVHSAGRIRTGSDTSGLSELQGTLTVDGDIVTFVAEDLQEKIKMSSPVSRWGDSSFPGSRSSTPSLYRQALQPNHHIIDPSVLSDLETHAKKVATCVDTMLENLSETLQTISSLTVDCMETYESSVCKTCDSVDVNIKSVYQLMAKCEELNNSMSPLYRMSGDIKHIKKMLEQLEHIVEHKS